MAVEEWVNGKDPDFFSSGLMAIKHRWSKCITLEGNYIKKEEVDLNGNKSGWLLIDSPSYIRPSGFRPNVMEVSLLTNRAKVFKASLA